MFCRVVQYRFPIESATEIESTHFDLEAESPTDWGVKPKYNCLLDKRVVDLQWIVLGKGARWNLSHHILHSGVRSLSLQKWDDGSPILLVV